MADRPASFNIRKPALDALDGGSLCFENGRCRAAGCHGMGSHGLPPLCVAKSGVWVAIDGTEGSNVGFAATLMDSAPL